MTFKQVEIKDLYHLVEIACTTFIETFSEQNDPTEFYTYVEQAFAPEKMLNELHTEGSVFYFAEIDDNTMGYFKINNNKSAADTDRPRFYDDFSPFQETVMTELERIYVKKEYHGNGTAQTMMSFVEHCARQNGSLYLWLGVWSENKKAIRFYEKCGFSIFGEHIFQIGDDAQLDYLMWKKL